MSSSCETSFWTSSAESLQLVYQAVHSDSGDSVRAAGANPVVLRSLHELRRLDRARGGDQDETKRKYVNWSSLAIETAARNKSPSRAL